MHILRKLRLVASFGGAVFHMRDSFICAVTTDTILDETLARVRRLSPCSDSASRREICKEGWVPASGGHSPVVEDQAQAYLCHAYQHAWTSRVEEVFLASGLKWSLPSGTVNSSARPP